VRGRAGASSWWPVVEQARCHRDFGRL